MPDKGLIGWVGFKASETLLGIETTGAHLHFGVKYRFKASETLLGIETQQEAALREAEADSKPLKPF